MADYRSHINYLRINVLLTKCIPTFRLRLSREDTLRTRGTREKKYSR